MPTPLGIAALFSALLALVPGLEAAPAGPPQQRVSDGVPAVRARTAAENERLLAKYEADIRGERSPYAADVFLKDSQLQGWLKAKDPERLTRLFTDAARLKDVMDILVDHSDPDTMRLALGTRTDNPLALEPPRLLAWSKKYASFAPQDTVREAVWEWGTLSEEKAAWLKSQGTTEAGWKSLKLPQRQETLGRWGKAVFDEAMKAVPKDQAELDAVDERIQEAWGALSDTQRFQANDRLLRMRSMVSGLATAREKLAGLDDPDLRRMLEDTARSGDLEDALSRLGRLFDKLGLVDRGLQAAAPASDGQKFADQDRQVVAAMLQEGLLRHIRGTTAGDRLRAFYAKERLDLVIGRLDEAIGQYDHETKQMTFNEAHIEEFLKTGGHTVARLKADPAVMEALVVQLAPLFVHEAMHHVQDAWARDQGIPSWAGQHIEVEAMATEALFILEKGAQDPAYFERLKAEAPHSLLARESLSKADRLRRSLTQFKNSILMYHYPDLPSLEAMAAGQLEYRKSVLKDVLGELDRRGRLSEAERKRIDETGADAFPQETVSPEEWVRVLQRSKSSLLADAARELGEETALTPAAYSRHRQRYESSMAGIRQGLADLQNGSRDRRPSAREVPPPSPTPARK